MFSKRATENYLMLDHRESPGFTVEEAKAARFGHAMPVGIGLFQFKCYTCCGCQRQIIVRPERDRERNYCRRHDRYMCDDCSLSVKVTGQHRSFLEIIDQMQEAGQRGKTIVGISRGDAKDGN
jgi:hypothetical protein